MKLRAACTKLTGQPRWAQRVEIAMYWLEDSCSYPAGSPVRSGLPRRTNAVLLPVSPTPGTELILRPLVLRSRPGADRDRRRKPESRGLVPRRAVAALGVDLRRQADQVGELPDGLQVAARCEALEAERVEIVAGEQAEVRVG